MGLWTMQGSFSVNVILRFSPFQFKVLRGLVGGGGGAHFLPGM